MAIGMDARNRSARVPMKAAMLGLSAVVMLAGAALGQSESDASEAEPRSNRISVRIAHALDNDPEQIFRFVADGVRYEPYSGSLRGDAGTYWSMAGNSVDQSSLLRTLLGAADIESRYAVGPIPEEVAIDLLTSTLMDLETLRAHQLSALGNHLPGQTPTDASLPTIADAIPFDEGATAQEVTDWVRSETEEALALIDESLTTAGISVDGGFAAIPDDEIERHTWVQALIGDTWTDLDPSVEGIAYGATPGAVAETLEEIPLDRVHMIELAVYAEAVEDGALTTEELIRVSGTAAELAGRPIIVGNIGGDDAPALARAFEQVLGVINYHPVISVDGTNYAGREMPFTDPASADGGGLGGGFFDTGSLARETTAEWFEMRVSGPGREPTIVRRDIFDRIGHAAREAGGIDVAELPALATVDIEGNGREVPAALHWTTWLTVSTGVPSLLADAYNQADGESGALAAISFTHQLATTLAGSEVAAELGVRPFVDAPNVTALTALVDPHAEGEDELSSAIDIWHRSHGVLPVDGAPEARMPAAVPGVVVHMTERALAGEPFVDGTETSALSVGGIMDAVADAGVGLRVVDTVDVVAGLPYDDAARFQLERSIGRGLVAVAPESPVMLDGRERSGWWLIDPVDGSVADQMDDGRGLTAAETIAVKIIAVGFALVLAKVGLKWLGEKFDEARADVKKKVKTSLGDL